MSRVTKSTAIILTFISTLSGSVNSQDLCSCSPQKYSFTVSLSQTCDNDTLAASPGVFTTVCSTDANVGADDDWSSIIPDVGESLVKRFLTDETPMRQMVTKDMTPVKIISLIFAEVNSDGSLVVINKDESLSETDLKDESVCAHCMLERACSPTQFGLFHPSDHLKSHRSLNSILYLQNWTQMSVSMISFQVFQVV